ncbi:phosphatidylinositol N-acetylglucosaminyltransferase subunit Q isoform X2 [Drosophila subpulchrella]|nr:phosphatidylinositol N-acetylglucosaminyltransferase subunit Q isoform X2 [Drosophila subpulchrella]
MVHTSIYKHFKEWQKTYDERSRPANIALDRILGIILMLILFSLATQPGDFLIQISHYVIDELYSLLKVLEGSPIGLKLNIHLNNFFLDCFKYHIELWSTFLDFIEPLVRQVFLAIGAFGCLGLTFQIALLVDLISIIGLHSHCFYIYTKVLYNVERKGLSVLWQVVRGNRYNILKGRTESHNYMNRQLYLATIFFSAILFLFPTTLVYYIVFAALKALTFATLSIFEFVRRQILSLPIEGCMKRVLKGCNDIDCLQIKDVSPQERAFLLHKNQKISVTVYKITAL